MDNAIKLINQKGTTLIEALVATAIIGIGFIAIFQMVTYSVRSIDVSSERTKINYLSDMILEDLAAYKSSENASTKLYDILINKSYDGTTSRARGAGNIFWEGGGCAAGPGIIEGVNLEADIINKWSNRFSQRRLGCNPAAVNTQRLNTYTICRQGPPECTLQNNDIFDRIYFGKVEIIFGAKSKNLYFIIH